MGLDFETTDGDDARKAIKALEQRLKDNLDESAKDRAHVKELEIEERNAKDKLRAIDSAFASRREDFAGVPREQTVIRLLDERDGLRKSYRDANAEYAKNIDAERAKVKALEAENSALKAKASGVPKAGDRLVHDDGSVVTLVALRARGGWDTANERGVDSFASAISGVGESGAIDDALAGRNGWRYEPAPVAAPEAWTDLETYSYRRAGDVLLLARLADLGGRWLTFLSGMEDPHENGATRDEAKAILDAAVRPKKAARYVAVTHNKGGSGECYGVETDGAHTILCMSMQEAEKVAAALNAAEPTP